LTSKRFAFALLIGVPALLFVLLAFADWRRGVEAAALEAEWDDASVVRVVDFGSTETLEILPLVNWHASSEAFRTEAGVSYLVRTDDETILFDVGFNRDAETPSPLEHNMAQLGVEPADIDAVFISHAHRDHVGGTDNEKARTFSMGAAQTSLAGKNAYVPVPMTYPGIDVQHVDGPRALSNGIASTGPIPRRLFIGRIDEQALVVNLAGKGLVVIVGCGHQTLSKLLRRLEDAFEEPLYAIVGDLHYPIPEGHLRIAGIDAQRRFASGDGFFKPFSEQDLDRELRTLDESVSFLALGGHDTHDDVLDALEQRMGERFQKAEVGTLISLLATP
jgi:metal-dependent hydrolase (beta-lactamase superfamily II)